MKKATSSLIAAIALVLFGPNLHAAEGAEEYDGAEMFRFRKIIE